MKTRKYVKIHKNRNTYIYIYIYIERERYKHIRVNKIIYKSGGSRNDIGKIRLDLIPPEALLELGEVFGEGAVRHGDENWKKGMPNSVVLNHMMRHLLLYMKGDRDEPHMGKVMFGCCVLIWNEENNVNLED